MLAIFNKSYNKWWVHWDSDIVLFEKNSKKYKIMGGMVDKGGVIATDMDLDKIASWGPKFVFIIKHMCDIVTVEPTEWDTGW